MSKPKGKRVRFTLRVPVQLYKQLERERDLASMNDYIIRCLEKRESK